MSLIGRENLHDSLISTIISIIKFIHLYSGMHGYAAMAEEKIKCHIKDKFDKNFNCI